MGIKAKRLSLCGSDGRPSALGMYVVQAALGSVAIPYSRNAVMRTFG